MGKSKNEDRVLDLVRRHKCKTLNLDSELSSSDYNHIIENSIQASEICRRTGISKQTVSDILRRLDDDRKIISFRFYPNGKVLTEFYDPKIHKSTILRVATKIEGESFVGEKILDKFNVRIVSSPETKSNFSASIARPDMNTENFRLHFVAGGNLLNISINKGVFDSLGGQPLILFLGNSSRTFQDDSLKAFDMDHDNNDLGHYCYYPEQSHLEVLGDNCVYLGIPDDSLYPPKHWPGSLLLVMRNPNIKRIFPRPDFGSLVFTIYPDMKTIGVSDLTNSTPIEYFNHQKNKSLNDMLDYKKYLKQSSPWPSEFRPGNKGDYSDLEYQSMVFHNRIDEGWLSQDIKTSSFWKTRSFPKLFSKESWLKLEDMFLYHNKIIAEHYKTDSFIKEAHNANTDPSADLIRNYFESHTGELRTPVSLRFRRFHFLMTS